MIKNPRHVAIELDGAMYRYDGQRLEPISNLRDLSGDIWLLTDLQDAISRHMTVEADPNYADVILRKKMQESGEFDDAVSIISHWKKKKARHTTEVFFTAQSARKFRYYTDLAEGHGDTVLLFPLYAVLFRALKTVRAKKPVAIVFQHNRFADIVVGTKNQVFYINRCVAFDTSEEQMVRLWDTVKAELRSVGQEHRLDLSDVFVLDWLDSIDLPSHTDDSGLKWNRMPAAPVIFNEKRYQVSFLTVLKSLSIVDSASTPIDKACFLTRKMAPVLNALLLTAALFMAGGFLYFQHRSDQIGNRITALKGQLVRMQARLPANFDREAFDGTLEFVRGLSSYRSVPSYRDIIADLSTGVPDQMKLEILKINYASGEIQVEVFGHIQAPFKRAHMDYQGLIRTLKQKNYIIQSHRFDTDIRDSQFLLKCKRKVG